MKKGRLPRKKKKELKKKYKIIFGERVHMKVLTFDLKLSWTFLKFTEEQEQAKKRILNGFWIPEVYIDEINNLSHEENTTKTD